MKAKFRINTVPAKKAAWAQKNLKGRTWNLQLGYPSLVWKMAKKLLWTFPICLNTDSFPHILSGNNRHISLQ